MKTIKLSDKQKTFIKIMREGYFIENSVLNSESAYFTLGGMRGKKINMTNIKTFLSNGLVEKRKKSFALEQYYLTDLGKTIEL